MADITQILLAAQSGDASLRKPAEEQLRGAQEANFPLYLVTLAAEMQNASKPAQSRYLAGLLIKNSLTGRADSVVAAVRQRWVAIDPQVKAQIKQTCLSCLTAPVIEVRKVAAQIVSRIALIELPRREWPDLVTTLCSATIRKADDGLRIATLQTLGYICEEIDAPSIAEHTNSILTAVVQGMLPEEPNEEVKSAALTALINSIDFIRHVFDAPNERDYLMRVVMESTRATSVGVRTKAYEVLVKIASGYYDKLAPYMQAIFNATVTVIKTGQDREEVVLQAIEFWSNLAEIECVLMEDAEQAEEDGKQVPEDQQSKRYVRGALTYLVDALTATLMKQEEDQDEDAWNVSLAGATCLALVAECVRDDILQAVMPFVTQHISSTDWHAREAATMAFGSILQGPHGIGQVFSGPGAINVLLEHMRDPVELVRESTAWAIGRVCQLHHTAIVATPERHQAVMAALIAGLKDVPNVASNCAWAIMNLADSLAHAGEKVPPDTTAISPMYQTIVAELLAVADRPETEHKLSTAVYSCLTTLVSCASRDCYNFVLQLADGCAARLERLISNQAADDTSRKDREDAQALVCGVVNECVKKLGNAIAPAAERFFSLYMRLYASAAGASAQEEAIDGLGNLASAIETEFARFLPQLFPVLHACLRNAADYEVCKFAVLTVGEVARVMVHHFIPYARDSLTLLVANLQNPSLDRSIKPPILTAIGDIAMAIGADFLPYLQTVMSMLSQAAMVRVDQQDEDQVDYLNELRESIFAAFTGIIGGMSGAGQGPALAPHVPAIIEAIRLVFSDTTRSDTLSRAIAGVIGDLARALGAAMKPLLMTGAAGQNLKAIVNEIEQSAEAPNTSEVAQWASEMLRNITG